MDRALALQLYEIYKLQKKLSRPIYQGELWSNGICSLGKCTSLVDALMRDKSIEEYNYRGSNVYRVTNIGMAHMKSYLDIKREIERKEE